jgi:hypothetical protein
MKKLVFALLLLLSLPVQAKPTLSAFDNKAIMRATYFRMWHPVLKNMFADAGPTWISLSRNNIIIANEHCGDSNVRRALNEALVSARGKMVELGMSVKCVSVVSVASR